MRARQALAAAAVLQSTWLGMADPLRALPVLEVGVDHAGSAAVGGTTRPSGCVGTPSCSTADNDAGSEPVGLPYDRRIGSSVASDTGTNSVGAGYGAEVVLATPEQPEIDLHGDDVVLVGQISASARLRDSQPDAFHTSAAADVSMDDWIRFEVPSLATGEAFALRYRVLGSEAVSVSTAYSGLLRVIDRTTGQTLLTTSTPSVFWADLDLSAYAGDEIEVGVQADLSVTGTAGFANGETSLSGRSFTNRFTGAFALTHTQVPEPGTAALLLVGLATLARRRSRSKARA